jgi:hypothetical protein
MDNSIEKQTLLNDISENFHALQFLINKIGIENMPNFEVIGMMHGKDFALLRGRLNKRLDLCVKALQMGFDVDEYPEYDIPSSFTSVNLSERARIIFKLLD